MPGIFLSKPSPPPDLEGIIRHTETGAASPPILSPILLPNEPENLVQKVASFLREHKTITLAIMEGLSTAVAFAYGLQIAMHGNGSAFAGVDTSLRVFGVRFVADVALLFPYYWLNQAEYIKGIGSYFFGDAAKILGVKQGVNLITLPVGMGALSGLNAAGNVPQWLGFLASGKITIPLTIGAKLWLFNRLVLKDKGYTFGKATRQTGNQMANSAKQAYQLPRGKIEKHLPALMPAVTFAEYNACRVGKHFNRFADIMRQYVAGPVSRGVYLSAKYAKAGVKHALSLVETLTYKN